MRQIDVSLMQIFLGLMRYRKATIVAAKMRLTQPAISHALKRLRAIYDDPLFIRKPHGFEPTHLAIQLEPSLRRAVELIEQTLLPEQAFDPAQYSGTFTIAAYDYELATILPPLIIDLANSGSRLQVETRSARGDTALAALAEGEVDLVLSYFSPPPNSFATDLVYSDTYRLVARDTHAVFDKPITPETYAAARHLLVSPDGLKRGFVDVALDRFALKRNVAASVPLFFPAFSILSQSDLVATFPERVVARFAKMYGLKSVELPFSTQDVQIFAVRHLRDAGNPMHDWLLARLRRDTADFPFHSDT